jgi:hypothetical protein
MGRAWDSGEVYEALIDHVPASPAGEGAAAR